MKQYWANAVAVSNIGEKKPFRLFTFDSVDTEKQAWDIVKIYWKRKFTILSAWVVDENRNVVSHECYVDTIGDVEYRGTRIEAE